MNNQNKNMATVVHVIDEFNVVINLGLEHGVTKGDSYLIYSIGPDIIDPNSGESLGALEIVRGRAIVRHVQEKISTLETIEFTVTPGKRKIIKRDAGSAYSIILSGLVQREEIEEGQQRNPRPLEAKIGDSARLITSN